MATGSAVNKVVVATEGAVLVGVFTDIQTAFDILNKKRPGLNMTEYPPDEDGNRSWRFWRNNRYINHSHQPYMLEEVEMNKIAIATRLMT